MEKKFMEVEIRKRRKITFWKLCTIFLIISTILCFILCIYYSLKKDKDSPCSTNPCYYNITCAVVDDALFCMCPAGYMGTYCEVTPCSNGPCLNNGTCTVAGESHLCVCSDEYGGTRCEDRKIKDCNDLPQNSSSSGVYTLYLENDMKISVFCEMSEDNGGWTVVQRRLNGKTDFLRFWDDYKNGFGDLTGEHWLGNDNLHCILQQNAYKVRFDLEALNGNTAYAIYDNFNISNEEKNYKLSISGYHGTAGDSMKDSQGNTHDNFMFTTIDRDNDIAGSNCAITKMSAWWHAKCTWSNINGLYLDGYSEINMHWNSWKGKLGLKTTRMMIKPN
ncbi:ficolin-2-like [Mytilus californianus]|uniref:ficolin-2-like n=1 Tax=Mytilus californianus TaxID=6549 RepID=UPI002247F44B|nr:ficolin-2-like [Mytilus californianus]